MRPATTIEREGRGEAAEDAAGGSRDAPKMVALGECCRVVNGTTPAAGDDTHWKGDVVWITPTDLGKLDGMHIQSSARTISRNALESHNLTLCQPGSVVLSSRAPIGHLGIAAVPLCTNQGCKTLVPRDGLKPNSCETRRWQFRDCSHPTSADPAPYRISHRVTMNI